MGERDWLTELTSALGDQSTAAAPTATAGDPPGDDDPIVVPDPAERGLTIVPDPDVPPPAAPAPPVDDELDLMGPGRSLEGWAEELASAFAEDDEPDDDADEPEGAEGPAAPAAAAGDDPSPSLAGVDNVLRFDSLGAGRAPAAPPMDEAAINAAVDVAVAVAIADVAAGLAVESVANVERVSAAEARLERIESLLTSDLSKLGPAVLADSIGDLEVRLADLRNAVGTLAERVEALPVPDPEALAALAAPQEGGVDAGELAGSLGELRGMVDRLTDRGAAQARFLAAHADTQAADAHQRDDLLRAILTKMETWD
jgi:hypothetical protein